MGDKKKAQFQCMNCGHLHWIEDPPDIDKDELYANMRCDRCKQTTNHLLVGDRIEDTYIYCDITKDERYFIY